MPPVRSMPRRRRNARRALRHLGRFRLTGCGRLCHHPEQIIGAGPEGAEIDEDESDEGRRDGGCGQGGMGLCGSQQAVNGEGLSPNLRRDPSCYDRDET